MSELSPAEAQAQRELQAENVKSELIYQGRRVTLRVDEITDNLTGHTYKREIIIHPGAVVMIPVLPDGQIILVRQWRRAAGKVLLELPAGTLEPNEPPAETANRELQEEIGYSAGKLTPLGGFFSAPGFCSEYLHVFLAENLTESRLDPDANEEIEVSTVTLDQAINLIENSQIEDAKSVAALGRYFIRQAHNHS